MRSGKDRRKTPDNTTSWFEDIGRPARERRHRRRDRRVENLNADDRQTLLSEMPGLDSFKPDRKD